MLGKKYLIYSLSKPLFERVYSINTVHTILLHVSCVVQNTLFKFCLLFWLLLPFCLGLCWIIVFHKYFGDWPAGLHVKSAIIFIFFLLSFTTIIIIDIHRSLVFKSHHISTNDRLYKVDHVIEKITFRIIQDCYIVLCFNTSENIFNGMLLPQLSLTSVLGSRLAFSVQLHIIFKLILNLTKPWWELMRLHKIRLRWLPTAI